MSRPMYIVDGKLSFDVEGQEQLSMPIGPFLSHDRAERFMESLGALFGEYEVRPLWSAYNRGKGDDSGAKAADPAGI